jgi:hypothetical protein
MPHVEPLKPSATQPKAKARPDRTRTAKAKLHTRGAYDGKPATVKNPHKRYG